jgi:glycosyltransferase involved in cell wall biosynthesis
MHVLQVTPHFPPTWAFGGIPRIVHGLSRALLDLGVEVTVLTTDAFDGGQRSGVAPWRFLDGIRVLCCPNLSAGLATRHQLYLPLGASHLLRGLPPPDILHLHGHRHLLNNLATSFHVGRPYVMTPNGTLPRHERKVLAKRVWDVLLSNRIPAGAARLVAVSRAEAAAFVAHGVPGERVTLIPNGLDLGEFSPLPPAGSFKRRLGLDPARPLVAYLGQISPRKGVHHLVAAFAEDPPGNAALVVAGNDMGGQEALRRAMKPGAQVWLPGLLEGADRVALLRDADVLVYPSSAEVFGLVPFEGLLAGAPCVVCDDCGCGELVHEAGAGLLVPHGDVPALRARIAVLLSDRTTAARMVARGRRYVETHLQWPRIAAQHRALYEEVLHR